MQAVDGCSIMLLQHAAVLLGVLRGGVLCMSADLPYTNSCRQASHLRVGMCKTTIPSWACIICHLFIALWGPPSGCGFSVACSVSVQSGVTAHAGSGFAAWDWLGGLGTLRRVDVKAQCCVQHVLQRKACIWSLCCQLQHPTAVNSCCQLCQQLLHCLPAVPLCSWV